MNTRNPNGTFAPGTQRAQFRNPDWAAAANAWHNHLTSTGKTPATADGYRRHVAYLCDAYAYLSPWEVTSGQVHAWLGTAEGVDAPPAAPPLRHTRLPSRTRHPSNPRTPRPLQTGDHRPLRRSTRRGHPCSSRRRRAWRARTQPHIRRDTQSLAQGLAAVYGAPVASHRVPFCGRVGGSEHAPASYLSLLGPILSDPN